MAHPRKLIRDGLIIEDQFRLVQQLGKGGMGQVDDARFDACGSGLGCTSYGEYSNCVTASESGSSGKSCETDSDCATGLYCSTQDLCEKWCEVGTNDCGAGSTCHGFTTTKTHAGNAIEFGACCTPPAGKGPCDTAPQCGCPPDQRCDIVIANGVSDGTTACMPIGPVAAFKACTTISDCGKGFTCSDGTCKLLCDLQPQRVVWVLLRIFEVRHRASGRRRRAGLGRLQ